MSFRFFAHLIISLACLVSMAHAQNQALSTSDDSIMIVPQHASLETQSFTIECWLKATGSINDGWVVRKAAQLQDGYGLAWSFRGNPVSGWIESPGGTFRVFDPSHPAGYLDEWHHFALTYRQTQGLALYVDGQLAAANSSAPAALAHTDHLHIGGFRSFNTQDEFIGLIDEVRFWNVARTQAEIQSTMFRRVISGPGLVSLWHMDGHSGDPVSANHGFLTGNARFVPSDSPVSHVFDLSANKGDWRGGYTIDLTGSFPPFQGTPRVTFGSTASPMVTIVNADTLTVEVPPANPGDQAIVQVHVPGFTLDSTEPFTHLPQLTSSAEVLPGGAIRFDVDMGSPSIVLLLIGVPSASAITLAPLGGAFALNPPGILVFSGSLPFQSFGGSLGVPDRGALVGLMLGFQALVLYDPNRLNGAFTNLAITMVR